MLIITLFNLSRLLFFLQSMYELYGTRYENKIQIFY